MLYRILLFSVKPQHESAIGTQLVCGESVCSHFIDLHVAVHLITTTCRRGQVFPIAYSCLHCGRLSDCRCVDLFLGALFFSTDSCLFLCQYHAAFIFLAVLGLCCCVQAFSSCGEVASHRRIWVCRFQQLQHTRSGVTALECKLSMVLIAPCM